MPTLSRLISPTLVWLSADAGMTVGHRRETQTRGVWLWKTPVPQTLPPGSGQAPVSLVFFDTEGFESTGQSDAYDDRIFAFAAVIASTLIYNLAEAVRESDIEKLSFAVELANAFFPSSQCAPLRTIACDSSASISLLAAALIELMCHRSKGMPSRNTSCPCHRGCHSIQSSTRGRATVSSGVNI